MQRRRVCVCITLMIILSAGSNQWHTFVVPTVTLNVFAMLAPGVHRITSSDILLLSASPSNAFRLQWESPMRTSLRSLADRTDPSPSVVEVDIARLSPVAIVWAASNCGVWSNNSNEMVAVTTNTFQILKTATIWIEANRGISDYRLYVYFQWCSFRLSTRCIANDICFSRFLNHALSNGAYKDNWRRFESTELKFEINLLCTQSQWS